MHENQKGVREERIPSTPVKIDGESDGKAETDTKTHTGGSQRGKEGKRGHVNNKGQRDESLDGEKEMFGWKQSDTEIKLQIAMFLSQDC